MCLCGEKSYLSKHFKFIFMRHILFISILLLFQLPLLSQNGNATATKTKAVILQPATPASAGFSAERLKRIDNTINEWIKDGKLNGCVALIVRNGKIVYHKAFGHDDLEKTRPLHTDNIFRIASQTKAITSIAMMLLYEEGKFLRS